MPKYFLASNLLKSCCVVSFRGAVFFLHIDRASKLFPGCNFMFTTQTLRVISILSIQPSEKKQMRVFP